MEPSAEEMEHEMKILNWYKLANEAALKSALVKHKKARQQPRYNPAAESVRERTRWLQRIIAEEQSKPLEVPQHTYKQILESERQEMERLEEQMWRRKERLESIQRQTLMKEMRRARYHQFLRDSAVDQLKAKARARSLGMVKDNDYEEMPEFDEINQQAKLQRDEQVEARAAAHHEYTMSQLQMLEQEVLDIVRSRTSHGPRAISVTVSAPDWSAAGNEETEHNAHVSFVKKRTESKVASPSKTFYSVRLLPSKTPPTRSLSVDGAMSSSPYGSNNNNNNNNSNNNNNDPHRTSLPRAVSAGTRRSSPPPRRDGSSSSPPPRSMSAPGSYLPRPMTEGSMGRKQLDLEKELVLARERMQRATTQTERRQRQEEMRQLELQKQDRVDSVIKEWLQGRLQRKLQREKRLKDRIKSDRNFLRSLQQGREKDAKEREKEMEAKLDARAEQVLNNQQKEGGGGKEQQQQQQQGSQQQLTNSPGGRGSSKIDLRASSEGLLNNTDSNNSGNNNNNNSRGEGNDSGLLERFTSSRGGGTAAANFPPGSPSGGDGNTSSVRSRRSKIPTEFDEMDDTQIDRRLSVLKQQQNRMEQWKPRVGGSTPSGPGSPSGNSTSGSMNPRRPQSRER